MGFEALVAFLFLAVFGLLCGWFGHGLGVHKGRELQRLDHLFGDDRRRPRSAP